MILHTNNPPTKYDYNCGDCGQIYTASRRNDLDAIITNHKRFHDRLTALTAARRVNAITDHGTVPAHTSSSYTRLEGVVGYTLSY